MVISRCILDPPSPVVPPSRSHVRMPWSCPIDNFTLQVQQASSHYQWHIHWTSGTLSLQSGQIPVRSDHLFGSGGSTRRRSMALYHDVCDALTYDFWPGFILSRVLLSARNTHQDPLSATSQERDHSRRPDDRKAPQRPTLRRLIGCIEEFHRQTNFFQKTRRRVVHRTRSGHSDWEARLRKTMGQTLQSQTVTQPSPHHAHPPPSPGAS